MKMKLYTNHLATPLKFHTFMRFLLPMQSFGSIVIIATLLLFTNYPFYFAEIALYSVYAVASLVAWLGCKRFKKFYLYALGSIAIAELVFYIILFAVSAIFMQENIPYSIYTLVISTLRNWLIFIYYRKRRKLFSKEGFDLKAAKQNSANKVRTYYQQPKIHEGSEDMVETAVALGEEPELYSYSEDHSCPPKGKTCPSCGHVALAEDRFCALCGEKL